MSPTIDAAVERIGRQLREQLVRLHQVRGLSQRDLARALGVSQPVIAKLEAGEQHNLELRTLVRLAHALGADVRIDIVDSQTSRAARSKRAAA